MAFHDIRLPDGLQYQSTAGASFSTIIQEQASGHEYRITRQAQGRHRYRLRKELQTEAEAKAIKAFALGRRGSLHSFRLKDFSDYTSAENGTGAHTATDQTLGVGDGTNTTFPLVKLYEPSGPNVYPRPIALPVVGTVLVAQNTTPTTAFTISGDGDIVMDTAPTAGVAVSAGFEFDVPVRFGKGFDDFAQMSADAFQVWSIVDMDCIEVLAEVESPERWNAGGGRDWGVVGANVTLSLNDGVMHRFEPSVAISAYLPSASRVPGGDRLFTIHNVSGSAGTIQIRDGSGAAVGSAITNGLIKFVGLARSGSTATWVVY